MQIIDTYYVLMRIGDIPVNEGTVYLASGYKFSDDIRDAFKCNNRTTALDVKYDYEVTKNHSCESDLKIVPLSITYEW